MSYVNSPLSSLTVEDFENHEMERMKCNAFEICNEAPSRVHGAVAPGGFQLTDSELFLGKKDMCSYIAVLFPGYYYYKILYTFFEFHFVRGDKYLEFSKCYSCPYCSDN